MKSNEVKVQVIIRFRALIEPELTCNPLSCVDLSETEVTLYSSNSNSLMFSFDKVLSPMSTQDHVFKSGPAFLVENVMNGFNGTIFTYGQIASGKTFTMFGDSTDSEKIGIIPRSVKKIFEIIDLSDETNEFLVKFSFFELVNEKIRDLLNPLGQNLKLKSDKSGVVIKGLREVYTRSDSDILDLISFGIENQDKVKIQQPRHTFVSLAVQKTSNEGQVFSKLYLVDLAGVERPSSLPTSPRSATLKSVNQSLSSLGMVICALSDKNSVFIPYRISKLTRILEESLGGNSRTLVIVTCSPSPANCEDTASSLRFGMRVKSVSNKPVINKELSMHELNIQYLQKLDHLKRLNKKLDSLCSQKVHLSNEKNSLLEVESPKPQLDLTEIRLELEEIYSRIKNQQETQDFLLKSIETDQNLLQNAKQVDERYEKFVLQLTSHSDLLEEELQEHEESAELLASATEKLSDEIESKKQQVSFLEQKISETFTENEHLKCKLSCMKEMRSSLSKAAVEEQFRRRIKEEKMNNKKLKDDMKQVQEEIDLLLFKRFKEYIVAEDLQVSAKKIFDLEFAVDSARAKYLEDEINLTPLQKILKNKQDSLEKVADCVGKDFRSVTAKFAQMNLEKSVLQKKIKRLEEKHQKIETDLKKVQKKLMKVSKFNEVSACCPQKITRSGSVRASLMLRQMKLSVESEFQE